MVSHIRYKAQQLQKEQRQRSQLIDSNRTKDKNRILIVDDGDGKPDNNTTLRLELERNGFKVDIFTNPLLALNHHFNACVYNMVVLDKKMSRTNAIELHGKFKKINPTVRICILGPVEVY